MKRLGSGGAGGWYTLNGRMFAYKIQRRERRLHYQYGLGIALYLEAILAPQVHREQLVLNFLISSSHIDH